MNRSSSCCRRMPSTLRLVIGTRVDPPLGLARLRARAEMADVRMSDLRFTDAEAATFLTEQLGLALTAVDVQRIVELTEGWPAGLYLGALSLRERTDAGAFIAEFAGSNRLIVDYLASEVLQRLTDKERTFLLRTSILDSFTAALCSAVVSETDTTGLLAELELHNLFLIPLDGQRQWFRYHHLFKELLQLRLASVEPELVPVLHQRAAAWFANAGDVRAAMRHSLLARDFDMAGKLFVEHWAAFVAAGQLATLEGWLTQLPESAFTTSPSLALAAAFVASVVRRPQAEVDRYIHLGDIEGEPDGPLPMGAHSVRVGRGAPAHWLATRRCWGRAVSGGNSRGRGDRPRPGHLHPGSLLAGAGALLVRPSRGGNRAAHGGAERAAGSCTAPPEDRRQGNPGGGLGGSW